MGNATDTRLFEARYDVTHAAQYIHVPRSTLRAWTQQSAGSKPLLHLPRPGYLSFVNLTEAFVLSAMRRRYRISMSNIRRAILYVQRKLNVEHPLAFQRFTTDKVDLFVETVLGVLNASRYGQTVLKGFHADLERIEWQGGRPIALFPLPGYGKAEVEKRSVRISPLVAFGKPVIAGTGVPTHIVAERFYAGESVEALAADYRLSLEEIEEAVRMEASCAA
jgi:uncharacterized protein (DUF433 family)